MKDFLLYIWQLPQNLIGLILIGLTKAKKHTALFGDQKINYYIANKTRFQWSGVSLGNYIVFANTKSATNNSIKHEHGHQIQSTWYGLLYLIIIGIPSFCGNIYDRSYHIGWKTSDRLKWYYSQPWEKQADQLGGVERYF